MDAKSMICCFVLICMVGQLSGLNSLCPTTLRAKFSRYCIDFQFPSICTEDRDCPGSGELCCYHNTNPCDLSCAKVNTCSGNQPCPAGEICCPNGENVCRTSAADCKQQQRDATTCQQNSDCWHTLWDRRLVRCCVEAKTCVQNNKQCPLPAFESLPVPVLMLRDP